MEVNFYVYMIKLTVMGHNFRCANFCKHFNIKVVRVRSFMGMLHMLD